MTPRERLHRYFDNQLSDEERRAFEAQLDENQREQLAAMGEVALAVRTTIDLQTRDVDFVSSVDRELAQRRNRARMRRWTPLMAVAAMAAAVLLWLQPGANNHSQHLGNAAHEHEAASIESLEVEGGMASVVELDDPSGTATVIFSGNEEEESL